MCLVISPGWVFLYLLAGWVAVWMSRHVTNTTVGVRWRFPTIKFWGLRCHIRTLAGAWFWAQLERIIHWNGMKLKGTWLKFKYSNDAITSHKWESFTDRLRIRFQELLFFFCYSYFWKWFLIWVKGCDFSLKTHKTKPSMNKAIWGPSAQRPAGSQRKLGEVRRALRGQPLHAARARASAYGPAATATKSFYCSSQVSPCWSALRGEGSLTALHPNIISVDTQQQECKERNMVQITLACESFGAPAPHPALILPCKAVQRRRFPRESHHLSTPPCYNFKDSFCFAFWHTWRQPLLKI